ncbi:BZ3500_MvSof-1268-A1-R1_Chr2-1g04408 [Microbotryum saponariae]|uniref:BZ3500_MvSof-1268-A1-R1_Chr2-1g04408 protein n=1 Tax=Microbotryum saponariae TaxID=289078 RepID=A0A2X0KDZ4_9BASI|nr:BZ3500_MvSof-1268-A1-R1_Chr2-1g04408 [Microbotryum saponariae]SCZ91622.1 BZ3501_MvSof-1269-A2-R1_Chr2-1g04064 [Microbotryum saponariae]
MPSSHVAFGQEVGWGPQYWPAYGEQKPRDLDWARTDIGYYFVTETDTTGFRVPVVQSEAGVKDFVTAAKANGKKAVFTIGGWIGSRFFGSSVVATDRNRQAFVKDVKAFLDTYTFDGVDFIGPSKLITAAIATSGLVEPDGSPLADMSDLGKVFDIINLMNYHVGGSWEAPSGPNYPLRTYKSVTSVVEVIDTFKKAGIPASKMMLGIPAYGYSYKLKSSTLKSQKIKGSLRKTDTNEPIVDVCDVRTASYTGMWHYVDLIDEGLLSSNGKVRLKGWTRHVDACSVTPFLFNRIPKNTSCRKAQRVEAGGGVYTFDSTGFNEEGKSLSHSTLDCA